jgi:hypothetical protein
MSNPNAHLIPNPTRRQQAILERFRLVQIGGAWFAQWLSSDGSGRVFLSHEGPSHFEAAQKARRNWHMNHADESEAFNLIFRITA